jgi:hypothetical protein
LHVNLETLDRLSGVIHRNQSLAAGAAGSLKIDPSQLRATGIDSDYGWA